MPPKKKSGASATAASTSTNAGVTISTPTSRYAKDSQALLQEVALLLQRHQTDPNNVLNSADKGNPTYEALVDLLAEQLAELEKPLAQLSILQKEEEKQRKKKAAAGAAPAPSTVAASIKSTSDTVSPGTPAHITVSSLPSQSHLDALSSWLRTHAPESLFGTSWEFVPHASAAEGTGVRATKDLEAEELFMKLPRSVMLTTDGLAKTSPIGKVLAKDPMCAKVPSLLLASTLMYERALGKDSKWAAYIKCLPRHIHVPVLWSVSQVRHFLQASPTVYEILMLQRNMIRQYIHLHATLRASGQLLSASPINFDFTWHRFQWAVAMVMSRQNRIPVLDQESSSSSAAASSPEATTAIALIPGWDMCNHRGHGAVQTFYLPSVNESHSHTMEPVKAGEPIYLYYGARSNAKLFVYAGFIDAQHRADEMEVQIQMNGRPVFTAARAASSPALATSSSPTSPLPVDPLEKIKLLLLQKCNMRHTFGFKLPLREQGGADPRKQAVTGEQDAQALAAAQEERQHSRIQWNALMHFLRVCALNTKENAGLALKHKPSFGNPLQPSFHFLPSLYEEHDLQAYTFLHDALVAALHAYPTTREHDESELVRDEAKHAAIEHEVSTDDDLHLLGVRHRLAVEMRRSEKTLLEQAIAKSLAWKEAEHKKVTAAAAAATPATATQQ